MEENSPASAHFVKETNKASTYDSALSQLVHILKNKATDNLKQLEDLWDSINSVKIPFPAMAENEKIRTSPSLTVNSLSPLNSTSDNSNDSSSSSNSSVMIYL